MTPTDGQDVVVGPVGDRPPPTLLETLAWDGAQLRHLGRHLERMGASARAFGLPWDDAAARRALDGAVGAPDPLRVRLAYTPDAGFAVTLAPLPAVDRRPVRLAVDEPSVPPDTLWVRHKTTYRELYEGALARNPGVDDVILQNTRGELTETTIASLAVRVDAQWWTPPVSAGCLPGVGRAVEIASGRLRERTLVTGDLVGAEVALVSSLRGWRPAVVTTAERP